MILRYLTQMYKQRDYIRIAYQSTKQHKRGEYTFDQIKEMPSFQDKQTPLLLSVSFNQYETFMYLHTELQCNLDVVDARKNNALHIAIINQNLDLIRRLVHIDSDYGTLRSQ